MDEEIIYESAIVAQFLADNFPSPLLPSSHEDPYSGLKRARINFFIDTWSTKLSSHQMSVFKASTEEKHKVVDEWVAAVEKEIEPLLADAAPFFGGSKDLTFAEAIVAPFLVRWYAFAEKDEFIPKTLVEKLDALPNFGKWSKAVRERESVVKIWDPEKVMEGFLKKYGKVFVSMKNS
jgi:glutathione S-transferase